MNPVINPLGAMANYKQFMLYQLVPKGNGKTDKFPFDPVTAKVVSAHDPQYWMSADDAAAYANMFGPEYGVAFVFTDNDPFFFIDIDGCLQDDGQWSAVSIELCNAFPTAAVEISQSGRGLHIFGSYQGVAPEHGCKNASLGLEMYHTSRFVALTGDSIVGDCNGDFTQHLQPVIAKYFPPTQSGTLEDWSDAAIPEWNGPEDDDILISKMLQAKSAGAMFGNKASFADLWNNNEIKLTAAYPSLNDVDPYDRSSADAALAQHLAFWTGKNHERIHRLMLRSGLVREKWKGHKKYLKEMTITRAVNNQGDVYNNGSNDTIDKTTEATEILNTDGTYTTGFQYLGPTQIQEYFKGCVYIQKQHRMLVPGGTIMKPEQFKAYYGGYEFEIDGQNSKTTTNAFEAFCENRSVRLPKVLTTCFRPEVPEGTIIFEDNETMVNTYSPVVTARVKGDPTLFLNHMIKLCPDERDRKIYLSYMAALVQYPSAKFQWCPLMQGTEGNGKSLIARCMAFAVGSKYTHLPDAQDLGNAFNGWLLDKLLIIVEEIFISHKRELIERIKPWITNERVEIQRKGVDQFTGDNISNWFLFTNFKDAIIVKDDGRRYAIFYTPQQTKRDIVKWGMDGEYFPVIYNWLKHQQGYEIVNEYLHTYQIEDEFNPAILSQRAPVTTSTAEAIELSVGSIEQEIVECIAQGRPGFAGGWVSSSALDKLLAELKAERLIPRNKRRLILQDMGYDWHPHLVGGRVHNVIIAEGAKPKLFIKEGNLAITLTSPADISKCYSTAQGYPEL